MNSQTFRVAFALPGLHRVDRGAEIAFMAVGDELAKRGHAVALFGSGQARPGKTYSFQHVGCIPRERFERWPNGPMFRDETAYEELSFAVAMLPKFKPRDFDLVCGCSYPFLNWAMRRPVLGGARPKSVFITQNGDYPARTGNREYRFFGCDGLVCINPDFYETNKSNWTCALIPNGVYTTKFRSGARDRKAFGLPEDKPVALMVSALIESKRVAKAIEAVARVPGVHLAVAGNGPERDMIDRMAGELLPGRFSTLTLASEQMPSLYHSADAFVHMSKAEAFGNVFIEALAAGLPVVAHDSPRHRWVVGETGFFADTEDIDQTVAAIQRALAASGTGKAQRSASIEKYDWKLVADLYEEFFWRLIGTVIVGNVLTGAAKAGA